MKKLSSEDLFEIGTKLLKEEKLSALMEMSLERLEGALEKMRV